MSREPVGSAPGLYLHVPFCSAICPYCDFSVLKAGLPARQRFVERLLDEAGLAAPAWLDPRPFDTVYFGGGTPSLLPADDLARVVAACRRYLPLAPEAWVFLEANPEDVTAEGCAAWRDLGVRTLSLGVQSFSDKALRFLGRRHTAEQARRAVETALAEVRGPIHLAVVDPPRTGMAPEALDALVALQPMRVAYVSCDPATLARDAARLVNQGYRPAYVQPVDMFPQTWHIECVALFERGEGRFSHGRQARPDPARPSRRGGRRAGRSDRENRR